MSIESGFKASLEIIDNINLLVCQIRTLYHSSRSLAFPEEVAESHKNPGLYQQLFDVNSKTGPRKYVTSFKIVQCCVGKWAADRVVCSCMV